jgi:hypothetical protein
MKASRGNRHKKGQALVEFILVAFIFFAFIFITINLTLIINTKLFLNCAAYIAGRDFAVSHSDSSARVRAVTFLSDVGLNTSGVSYARQSGSKFGDFAAIKISMTRKNIPLEIVTDFFGEKVALEGDALTLWD